MPSIVHSRRRRTRRGAISGGLLVAAVAAAGIAAPVTADEPRPSGAIAPQSVTSDRAGPRPPVLVGAGDIATARSGDSETAALIEDLPRATVFTTGDNVQGDGTAAEFADYYDPTWGAFRSRTRPSPGNHDYKTSRARPYYNYFGKRAGPSRRGYYSFDLGAWHIVSLNSEIDMSRGSAQEVWLRRDLRTSRKRCTLAYWHKPLFTSGALQQPTVATRPLFRALYRRNAEVVVNGHNHQYERFAPMAPSGRLDRARGIREFVVGTGGASHFPFGTIHPNSRARNDTTFGVLKFTLRHHRYRWDFIPVAGRTYTDSGSTACH